MSALVADDVTFLLPGLRYRAHGEEARADGPPGDVGGRVRVGHVRVATAGLGRGARSQSYRIE
jgi:hypothetical protein